MNPNRNAIVAGNWKMNLSLDQATRLAGQVQASPLAGLDVAVFPAFPWLIPVGDLISDTGIVLGAQNCWTESAGAFTGEVSPLMVAEIASAVLAGHSERRHVLGESNRLVGQKVASAMSAGLQVYLCVGELFEEREAGRANETVAEQLVAGLASVSAEDTAKLVVAYEPVWAIGTGVAATSEDAQEMCAFVRAQLDEMYTGTVAERTPILYGGSVTATNASDLFQMPDIDGALVGGASLDAGSFNPVIEAAARTLQL